MKKKRLFCFLFLQLLVLVGTSVIVIPETMAAADPIETTYAFLKNKTGRDIHLGMTMDELVAQCGQPTKVTKLEEDYTLCEYDNMNHMGSYYFKNNTLEGFTTSINGYWMAEVGQQLGFPDDLIAQPKMKGGMWLPSSPAMKAVLYANQSTALPAPVIIAQAEGNTLFSIYSGLMYQTDMVPMKKMFHLFKLR